MRFAFCVKKCPGVAKGAPAPETKPGKSPIIPDYSPDPPQIIPLGAESPHLVGVLLQLLLDIGKDEDATAPERHRVGGILRQA